MSEESEFRKKVANFLAYHDEHADFYQCALKKSVAIQGYSTKVNTLLQHIIEKSGNFIDADESVKEEKENETQLTLYEKSNKINADLEALKILIDDLRRLSGNALAYAAQADLYKISQQLSVVQLPLDNLTDDQLLIFAFALLNNEKEILRKFILTSKTLVQTLDILERIVLYFTAHADLAPFIFSSQITLLATQILNDAEKEAQSVADFIRAGESSWTELNNKARQLGIQSEENKQVNLPSDTKDFLDLDGVFRIIEEWAQKNLQKALFQLKEKTVTFKFLRVSEISRVFIENHLRYNLRSVDALIEYDFGGVKNRHVSFQIDSDGKIVGFNL